MSKKFSERIFFRPLFFILRPFANSIRYLMLKIMKKLRPPGDDRPARAAASHLLEEVVLPSGFRIFGDGKFRDLVKFNSLPATEQDRIFNELETAGICLALFCLDFADALVKPEDYHFWREVKDRLPKEFEENLIKLGAEKENAHLYQNLISMRYHEYKEMTQEAIDIWNSEEPRFREFQTEAAKHSIARVHAIAISVADHIRRGKLKKIDRLPSFLRSWLLYLNEDIGKLIKKL